MEVFLSRFNLTLFSPHIPDQYNVPGWRTFYPLIEEYKPVPDRKYIIDTRSNVFIVSENNLSTGESNRISESKFSNFDKWLVKNFNEYKDSNFKFGNNLYEPTEQIELDKFFSYLKSCNRDDILEIIQ